MTVFNNGKVLINALPKKPDVVLLDYNLNGENGGVVMKKVHEKIPDLPVIMV